MKYANYFAVAKKLEKQGHQICRAELISQFTAGKKNSLRELTDQEYKYFVADLSRRLNDFKNSPENKMRQKVYALLVYKMKFSESEMNSWCVSYSRAHKPLNEHDYQELILLVHQAQQMYNSHIAAI